MREASSTMIATPALPKWLDVIHVFEEGPLHFEAATASTTTCCSLPVRKSRPSFMPAVNRKPPRTLIAQKCDACGCMEDRR